MPNDAPKQQLYPYDMPCSERGCTATFRVATPNYESTGLPVALRFHMESVHKASAAPQPEEKRVKADDIDKSCVNKVEKGLHEMTREEWRSWLNLWTWWRGLQPAGLDLTTVLMGRFPKISAELASTRGNIVYKEESLLAAIEKLAVKKTNVIRLRQAMRTSSQGYDESVSAYAKRLGKAAIACDFLNTATCPSCSHEFQQSYMDEEVRDAFFCGLYDKDMLEKLCMQFQDRVPSLQEIVTGAEGIEASRTGAARPAEATVAAISTYKKNSRSDQKKNAEQQNEPDRSTYRCHNCSEVGHIGRNCNKLNKYKGHKCKNCGKLNHHESNCRQKRPATPAPVQQTQTGSTNSVSSTQYDGFIFQASSTADLKSVPRVDVKVNITAGVGKDVDGTRAVVVRALADTGASHCIISERVWKNMGCDSGLLSPTSLTLGAANGTDINVLGGAMIDVSVLDSPGNSTTTAAAVCAGTGEEMFLSKAVLMKLGIVHEKFPEVLSEKVSIAAVSDESCPCTARTTAPPPPSAPPVPLTEANRERLQDFLLQYYSSSTFNNCTHQALPGMAGEPLRVHIDKSVPPTTVNRPSTVSVHWQKKVKAALDADERMGVIEKVPANTPQLWCAPMHVVAKHNGDPRRVVDFTKLNAACSRQTHVGSTPFDLATKVPAGRLMSTMDAWNGFHSVPVHPDDFHYFTFVTPWGRYRYKMAPQGWLASGDAYTHRYDQITDGIDRHIKVIDDSLIWSSDIQQAWYDVTNFLSTVGGRGVVLNSKKFRFATRDAEFAGFQLGNGKVKPLEKHVAAIRHFPEPRTLTDMRSFFALCEQVSYAYTIKEQLKPFRELVKTKDKKHFFWDEHLSKLFSTTKNSIADKVCEGIMSYDPNKVTTVETDWSKDGIGYWLRQKYCNCTPLTLDCCSDGWRVAMCGSRFCSPAESRYSPVEGELLAVTWALKKTRIFTLGASNLYIVSDHKPLVGLIKGDEKAENRRLTRLREELTSWNIRDVWYRAGKCNAGPDALSRYPAGINLITERKRMRISTAQLQKESARDDTLQLLLKYIRSSFPASRSHLPIPARAFWNARLHLHERNNLVYFGDRVVIPEVLKQDVLDGLHLAHQGVTAMVLRAQSAFFWPGIQADIQRRRDSCISCMESAPSQSQLPPRPLMRPEYPFQAICIDYCHYAGHRYGVMIDRFSNWPCVWKAKTQSAAEWLNSFCMQFGIPEEVSTDGGPEFTSGEMAELLKDYGIRHRVSSAYHPHSNLRAELGVKDVKRLLRENVDSDGDINNSRMTAALLTFKNTPDRDTRMSPAEYVFGRPINDMLPSGKNWTDTFGDDWKRTMAARELAVAGRHERCYEKLSEHTKELPPLHVGDHVAIQNQHGNQPLKWDKRGVIVSCEDFDKYGVKVLGSGRLTYRNRRYLRQYTPELLRTEHRQQDIAVYHPTPVAQPPAANESTTAPPTTQPLSKPSPTHNLDPEPVPTEPERPGTEPAMPVTTVTSPIVRRSSRSNAGKTTRYDEYVSAICELAKTLCNIELPRHIGT